MLWLALHLPQLSLEAFCATLAPADAARAIALVAEYKVIAVNAAAARCGIRPGLKRATALALASGLLLAEAHAGREAAALQSVAHAALAFTPAVSGHDGQTVLLEVQASLRLFGGLPALLLRLHQALAPLGHRVQVAAAPTALGAALLARWCPPAPAAAGRRAVTQAAAPQHPQADAPPPARIGRQAQPPQVRHATHATHPANPAGPTDLMDPTHLNHLTHLTQGPHLSSLPALQQLLSEAPVWLLGPGREHWEALQGMGLHSLSDLRQLPRSGLARRFGAGLLHELDRAWGLQPDPRVWIELPAAFESRLELFARADSAEQVLYGAAVLLARLVAWAQARQSRVAAFTLFMHHEPRHRDSAPPATELRVALAEPALDPAHLQLLLRERLQQVLLAAPTLELRLHCRHLVQAGAPNGELFPTRSSEAEGLTRLLERLRARLGDEQVLRLQAVADHRPERASRMVPAQTLPGSGAGRGDLQGPRACPPEAAPPGFAALPLHRPAWLLPDPLPLAERDALPLLDGRPLQLLSGPERIETGWWDGEPAARDYFIAQAQDGALVWVWRGRLPSRRDEVNWFLQGRFG
jgi:protein ImuB